MGQFEHVKFSQSICVLGRCGCLLGVVIVLIEQKQWIPCFFVE